MRSPRFLIGVALAWTVLPAASSAQIAATASGTVTVQSRATAAILIPAAAIELRAAGVPAPEVRTALVEVKTSRVAAPEVHRVLVRSTEVVRVHGPIPNYGMFVSVRVRDGVRGPELYEVIEAEHRRQDHAGADPSNMGTVVLGSGAPMGMATIVLEGSPMGMGAVEVQPVAMVRVQAPPRVRVRSVRRRSRMGRMGRMGRMRRMGRRR